MQGDLLMYALVSLLVFPPSFNVQKQHNSHPNPICTFIGLHARANLPCLVNLVLGLTPTKLKRYQEKSEYFFSIRNIFNISCPILSMSYGACSNLRSPKPF